MLLPGCEAARGALTPRVTSAVVGAVVERLGSPRTLEVPTEGDQVAEHRLDVGRDGLDSLAIEIIHSR